MIRFILLAIAVSGALGQYRIAEIASFAPRTTTLEKLTSDVTVLTPSWSKIIKDTMKLSDVDKIVITKPLDEIRAVELCMKFNIGCLDIARMAEKKEEMDRKEEDMKEKWMRDELCKKMGVDCRIKCEKMGVMCTKEEMCKKMGMDCSKKDMCELMAVDCKKENMCDKMGVMCTMEDMCKKKGIGCHDSVLIKSRINSDVMWVKDEFDRPILMDADGRRLLQPSLW